MLSRALPILALWAAPAIASDLYSPQELQTVRDRAAPKLELVLKEDIVGRLPRDLRPTAARISLEFPETGPGPLAFYAEPARQVISMPLESIRFYDDIATLFAWLQSKGCVMQSTQTYLHALLRDGQPLPSPLRAFAVDRDTAFDDAFTYDVSAKAYSAGLQFILAHEVGHLLLNHRTDVSSDVSQWQEAEADAFAMDHFARIGTMPAGMIFYFMATWWQDPIDGAEIRSSHPTSPARIAAIAARMAEAPMDFAHAEPDSDVAAERVASVARDMAKFAELAADDDLIRLTPFGLASDYPLSRLATVCPSE